MMERQDEPERLFYNCSLQRYIPADHLLRQIDSVLDLSTISRKLGRQIAREEFSTIRCSAVLSD